MPVRPAKTQISLGIRPVWSESSLCDHWVAKDPSFLHADSEDWVFAGHSCHFVGFVMRRLKYLWPCIYAGIAITWRLEISNFYTSWVYSEDDLSACFISLKNWSLRMSKPTKWHVRPAKTLISMGIRLVWSESSLRALRIAKDLSGQRRLIRLGGCPSWSESLRGARVTLLVLSCTGSNNFILLGQGQTRKLGKKSNDLVSFLS